MKFKKIVACEYLFLPNPTLMISIDYDSRQLKSLKR